MHALRRVHELVAPGGIVVDLHPTAEERVEAAGETLGVIHEPDWLEVDLPNAERRLQEAIAEGLFALEAETHLELLQHFDEPEELLEAKSEHLTAQSRLARRVRAASGPLVTREPFVFRRLRNV